MGCEGMKQHISKEDLQELTPEQQEKLRSMWQPEEGDFIYHKHEEEWCIGIVVGNEVNWEEKNFVSFKIIEGNMGWLGRGNGNFLMGDVKILPLLNIGQLIQLLKGKTSEIGETWVDISFDGELIDELWQAVKSML